ncbi:MAG: hypothetical protein LQ342_008291 [Letrouitia transgressa]|nr:MAG: hypothetical protein LQ342_008291 [Letrouitia transgressa]
MAPTLVHLPNGQTLSVSPVFAGFSFKANDLNVHQSAFPPGWTIILESEVELDDDDDDAAANPSESKRRSYVRRYKVPTLHSDNMFISAISNPSNIDFKPATSPTRQIAMMLWATLWWYFHQRVQETDAERKPKPNPHLSRGVHTNIPTEGMPKGDWRINIKREGIFKGRHLLPKLERMGIISTEDSCVGANIDDRSGEGWTRMFVSQRSFWLIDARIFLFTLSPTMHSPFPGASPYPSRPGSPNREDLLHTWMNEPRVNAMWGAAGPRSAQEDFLKKSLNDKHSFPIIGCWDGKPFGYFEVYWVKEDQLGRQLSSHDFGNWDRGFHALVGEQEFRGPHRVKVWMSALVHYCWLADSRTERVLAEPRVDNKK